MATSRRYSVESEYEPRLESGDEMAPDALLEFQLESTPAWRRLTDRLPGWDAVVWGGAYAVLTLTLLFAGVLTTATLAAAMSPGVVSILVVVGLGFGTFAAAPTLARLVVVKVHRSRSRRSAARNEPIASSSLESAGDEARH